MPLRGFAFYNGASNYSDYVIDEYGVDVAGVDVANVEFGVC